jgi:2-keto-4-pentenoate hydratase/2-oxohepta-3-ene-1,7-dioic acid hydratase in catechol pathway
MASKYKLGYGLLNQQAHIIIAAQGLHFDATSALADAALQERLSLQHEDVPTSLLQMIQQWATWKERLPQLVTYLEQEGGTYNIEAERIDWLPPIMYPSKLICLGANYKDHNEEMGNNTRTKFPYTFLKPPTTTLVGSGTTITLPEYAHMIDWEVELALVIGRKTRNVHGDEVMTSIAGYSVLNDVSARDWVNVPAEERSFMGLDWVMLKGFDESAPMGPYITPAEFVPDPQTLNLSLTLNGQIKQNANTVSMVFTVYEIVEHLASVMTLEPGDVIATGTPSGVGFGRKPPEFLRPGDRMVASVEGLGNLETTIRS